MRVEINGETFWVAFHHDHGRVRSGQAEWKSRGDTPVRSEKWVANPQLRKVKLNGGALRTRKAQHITTCYILTKGRQPLADPHERTVVCEAAAVCSRSEDTYDPEYGRQGALARALVQLPRAIGAPLLNAYMASAPREGFDLSGLHIPRPGVTVVKPGDLGYVNRLADALQPKAATVCDIPF